MNTVRWNKGVKTFSTVRPKENKTQKDMWKKTEIQGFLAASLTVYVWHGKLSHYYRLHSTPQASSDNQMTIFIQVRIFLAKNVNHLKGVAFPSLTINYNHSHLKRDIYYFIIYILCILFNTYIIVISFKNFKWPNNVFTV